MIFMASAAFLLVVSGIREVRSCNPSVTCRTGVEVCELYPRMRSSILTSSEKTLFSFFTSLSLWILRITRQCFYFYFRR